MAGRRRCGLSLLEPQSRGDCRGSSTGADGRCSPVSARTAVRTWEPPALSLRPCRRLSVGLRSSRRRTPTYHVPPQPAASPTERPPNSSVFGRGQACVTETSGGPTKACAFAGADTANANRPNPFLERAGAARHGSSPRALAGGHRPLSRPTSGTELPVALARTVTDVVVVVVVAVVAAATDAFVGWLLAIVRRCASVLRRRGRVLESGPTPGLPQWS